jgi:hypothetical protein
MTKRTLAVAIATGAALTSLRVAADPATCVEEFTLDLERKEVDGVSVDVSSAKPLAGRAINGLILIENLQVIRVLASTPTNCPPTPPETTARCASAALCSYPTLGSGCVFQCNGAWTRYACRP